MSRVRGQALLTDISSLVDRVKTLELVTFGDDNSAPPVQDAFTVGSISVPVSSALSASAAVYVPSAQSTSASVSSSVVDLAASSSQVYVTPLAERLRGGAPTASVSNSESVEMIVPKTAEQFLARWAALSEAEREAFELDQCGSAEQTVVNEALKKTNLRTAEYLKLMAQQLSESKDEAAAAKAEAAAARLAADAAVAGQAQQAAQVNKSDVHKPKPPPSFENKEKDLPIQKWLPVVESYLEGCPDKDYLRNASSFLGGKPRSFWQSKFDLRLKSGPPIDNPSEFFREVMMSGYGLKDDVQGYWDTCPEQASSEAWRGHL